MPVRPKKSPAERRIRIHFWAPARVSLFRWAFLGSLGLDFTCLSVFVSLHADCLARTFPGASVR